ncbi:glycosyltransferase family 4 protein [Vibrio sp. 10N.261.51.A3]|uniref:glycosyltransferase family 4 protein n=1 Tax=Vibrio sp. 10N.261.51.A3 TaxID=3229673 RepID=UPI00354F5384
MKIANKNNNIAFIIEGWSRGGTENYCVELSSYLKNKKYNVDIFILGENIDIEFLNESAFCFNNVTFGKSIFEVANIVARAEYIAIHNHLYSNLLYFTTLIKFISLFKCNVVTTLHMPLRNWGNKVYYQWIMATYISDKVFAVANHVYMKRDSTSLRKANNSNKFEVIYAKVSLGDRSDDQVVRRRATFNICGCGRLSKEKNWPLLLQSLASFKDDFSSDFHLTIVGGGDMELELQDMIKRLGLCEHVHITGQVPKSEVVSIMSSSDLLILPSKFEGLPLVILEAMALRLPVLASNIPAVEEIVTHEKNGLVFNLASKDDLTDKIHWCFEHLDRLQNLGKNGYEFYTNEIIPKSNYDKYIESYHKGTC